MGSWALLSSLALGILLAGASRAATVDHPIGQELADCEGTGAKPQSKLWSHDGSWWCVLPTSEGNRIHELVAATWVPRDVPGAFRADDRDGRADVLWDGERLIVLVFGPRSQLVEFSWDGAARSWQLRPGFPLDLPIPAGSETAVLDQDSRGRLWVTWTADRQVRVAHAGPDHRTWDFPGIVLRDSVSDDDISTVVAFGGDAVGVVWSDQARDEFGFRVRRDADDTQAWSDPEVIQAGDKVADDHLNAAVDGEGRLYVVSKNGRHELSVHMRDPQGVWTTRENVLEGGHGTRPLVMVAEADAAVCILYTRWHDGLEIIEARQARLGTLDFGAPQPFIVLLGEDIRLTDVTGTKQSLPPGTRIAVAHAVGRAWWNGWGMGISPDRARRSCQELSLQEMQLTDGAALALAFDEGRGSVTADASPEQHRVSLGGTQARDMSEPGWVEGVSGTALRFEGWRSFVAVEDAPSLTPPGSFTLEAWVRRFKLWDNHVVVGKGAPGERSYQLRVENDNRIEFLRDVVGGQGKHRVRSSTTIEDSLWHHIAAVVDLERRQMRLYLDGVCVASEPDSGITVHTPSFLYLGAREYKDRLREWWVGDIDLVRLSHEVRYDGDFEPPRWFPSRGVAVFLSWAPPVVGPGTPPRWEVYRRVDDGADESILAQPLSRMSHRDVPKSAGRLTYRIRPAGGSWPDPPERSIDWRPGRSPAVPAGTNGR